MARGKRDTDDHGRKHVYAEEGPRKLARRSYHHLAEVYGESETRGLRPWARRRVLRLVGAVAA